MFRRIRITVLLLILAVVALNTVSDSINTTRWNAPITVALFPINADGSEATERYLASLSPAVFAPLEEFFQDEANHYGIKLDRPMRFTVAPQIQSKPPTPPVNANALQAMYWSLQLRWWAWRVPPKVPGPTPRIRLFLLFHDPARTSVLEHSTGLKKGLIGAVQLFADTRMTGSNLTVIAHELLHTLGATDKYDSASALPKFPDGYAKPDSQPRYPQQFAELMAGRIPLSPTEAKIPETLQEVLIGPATAAEIGWQKND
jgi:hypothetical protein